MLRASAAIAKHEFRIMRTDLETPLFLIAMPLLMMAFMKPMFRVALAGAGFTGANGAEQAVPGMAVMFSAFFSGYIGFSFLREHGWGTWERLRGSPASPLEIMMGKIGPGLLVSVLQLLALFIIGGMIFDLRVSGSILALGVMCAVLGLTLISFGVMITALSRTSQQLNAISSAGGMLFTTFGGALVPLPLMPGWTRSIAPITPTYWAMRGMRSVILEEGSWGEILLPIFVLTLFLVAFAAVAVTKFRFEETKINYG